MATSYIYNSDGGYTVFGSATATLKKPAVKSASKIEQDILKQFNTFIKSLSTSKVPLKLESIADTVCIRIVKPIKNKVTYNPVSGKKLVLAALELEQGVRIPHEYPDCVIFPYIGPGYNFPFDMEGHSKYIGKYDLMGQGISVFFSGGRYSVYQINKQYKGEVLWDNSTTKPFLTQCLTKDIEAKAWTKGTINLNELTSKPSKATVFGQIKNTAFVKIKAYDQSAKIFRYGKLKKTMFESNALFTIKDILLDYTCKEDGLVRDIVEISYENRSYKFVGEELEFIYPDIANFTKGFTLPKDRVVKAGVTAKLVDNRGTRIPKNTKVSVGSNIFKDYYHINIDKKEYIVRKQQLKVI